MLRRDLVRLWRTEDKAHLWQPLHILPDVEHATFEVDVVPKAGRAHDVQPGNPVDAARLEPAIKRVICRTGRKPCTVAADRGYGEQCVDDALHEVGVRDVVIPRKGRPTKARQAEEHRPAFRRHVKWRTGCEGRISSLKRGYGWDGSRIDTTEGAKIWVGHGVLTHNLVKISALAS